MIYQDTKIELARIEDALEIALISKNFIERGLVWRWTERKVKNSILSDTKNVAVARLENKIVGFGIMHYGDEVANLDLLAVKEGFRKEGIGKKLVKWLEEVAFNAGIGLVTIQTLEQNADAQAFYQKLEYINIGKRLGYYQNNVNAILMEKRLRK